ncbi:MAG TPA: nucleotidyltransferase family protein [Atribacteraceae bacterium]|nr:nucleotidyltransferase family protein [Atribacteraceae bacterium]
MPDAIILAGEGEEQENITKFGVGNRALLVIQEQFMVEYVIEALKAVSSIERIVVVGPVKEFKTRIGALVEDVVPPGYTPFESTLNGLKRLQTQENVLVLTSDIPLVKGEMIEDFLFRCEKTRADFYYPIVRKEVYQKKFSRTKRTFVCLKEGCFSGGNLFLINPSVVERRKDWIMRVIRTRKSPLAIARLLGIVVILKYLLKRLSVKNIEKRVENILGMKGLAIITPYPEMGFDVDLPEHVDLAKRFLKN